MGQPSIRTGASHARCSHDLNPLAAWRLYRQTSAATDDPTGWYQRAFAIHPVVAGARISQLSVANLSADER
jgi:hypothetical protein